MALQIIKNIDVDFSDKKYILINSKQLDRSSRKLLVTCYNDGQLYPINVGEHSAYIRYRKADNHGVFNLCSINQNGTIVVELTEQMLASDGICYADLVITNKGDAKIDADTGKVVTINNASILSTMIFCIDVAETAISNSEIESSYEFNGLNDAISKVEAEYSNVIKTAKSWAIGGTGLREDEDINCARYWSEVAAQNAVGVPSVVTSIKGDKETSYRSGQVNITTSNIGAISIEDIATVDETKDYLGIE